MYTSPDTIYCLYGESGSGKTALSKELQRKGYRFVSSFTTRPRRNAFEEGHNWINEGQYSTIKDKYNIVAYNEFGGYRYFATENQIRNSDFYIVDPTGIDSLKESLPEMNIVPIHVWTEPTTRYLRMRASGHSIMEAIERGERDKGMFYHGDFYHLVDNNGFLEDTVEDVIYIVENNV